MSPHFVAEVLAKWRHIQNLILGLIQISQECTRKRIAMKNLVQELLQASQNLWSFLYHEGYFKACIKDAQLDGPTISIGEGCEITCASNHEDSMDVQHQQSTLKSLGNNEPLSGPQIGLGFVEYENRRENLSLKQQDVEPEMQTVGPTNFKGPTFKAKHVPIHEDSIIVQYQQSKLDYEQLDGPELQHVEYQQASESFSNKLEELPYMDLSKALKEKNKRGKNMTHEETLVLLSCKVEGGRFCKGSGGATHWNLISEEIEKKLGSRPSANQCRLRYDTLLKAYKTYKKHCMKTVCGAGKIALCNFFPMGVFNSLNEDLQSSLLNLVQECSWTHGLSEPWNGRVFDLEEVCRRLAILPNRESREILNYVLKLWELKLVSVVDMDFEEGKGLVHIDLWKGKTWFLKFWLYKEISKEVLHKNPHLKTYYNSFPIEQSSLQYVKVLSLNGCFELKHLDLREFPSLRFFAICCCPQFNLLTGWEFATSLGSIDISWCIFYLDFPNLQYLSSLREFEITRQGFNICQRSLGNCLSSTNVLNFGD